MSEHDDLRAIRELDQALDELAAGRRPGGGAAGDPAASADPGSREAAGLAALAAELADAIPGPPPGAAERGRAALLAAASRHHKPRPPLRLMLLAAATLLALVLVPAAAGAEPDSPLWAVREAGQSLRAAAAPDAVAEAKVSFDSAAGRLAKAREELVDHADDPPDKLRERVANKAGKAREQALEGLAALKGASGPAADAARARGRALLAEAEALLSGPLPPGGDLDRGDDGAGTDDDPGDERSGDDDPSGDDGADGTDDDGTDDDDGGTGDDDRGRNRNRNRGGDG